MIVIDLCCEHDHRFEGWFASTEAFENQRERALVSCPVCGSGKIRRLPSAPYVQTRGAERETAAAVPAAQGGGPPVSAAAVEMVKSVLRRAARNAEDVGERFPDEARRMHYGEIETRNIRGAASHDEVGELIDEGIMVLPVPPEEDVH